MFTGIVEHKGIVSAVEPRGDRVRIHIDVGPLTGLEAGDSIAVNGVCLTITATERSRVGLDVVTETLQRSNLGSLGEGDLVNLERAMPASGRFDGHLVQGHVDGVGHVAFLEADRGGMTIEAPADLMRYIAEKGSVTVDGVSLTVVGVDKGSFEVALIPYTLAETTLGLRNVDDTVNLEVDVLAKYVERLLKTR